METTRAVDDNGASCSKAGPKARVRKGRPRAANPRKRTAKAKAKQSLLERKAEYKEYRRLLTSLMFNNPSCKKPKKSRCKLFSLEECSDIEPISEDDDIDKPICEIQPFDTVPRVFSASTYASYPRIEEKKGEDWVLPPWAKKYVKEVVLQEWTAYQSENSDVVARVSKEQKQNLREELVSEAMEFVTTSIHDKVMSRRRVDDKNEEKKKGSK